MDFKELREKITERVLKTFDFSSVDELVKQNPNMKPSEASFDNIDFDYDQDVRFFIKNCAEEVIDDNLQEVILLMIQTFPAKEYQEMSKKYKGNLASGILKLIEKKQPQFLIQVYNALENQCVQRAKVLLAKKHTMKGTKTAVWGKKSHRDDLACALSNNFRRMI